MKVVIKSHADLVGLYAAEAICDVVAEGLAVLGLCTGTTPEYVYAELGRRHRLGTFSLADATVFMLDEYVGIRRDSGGSYHRYAAEKIAKRTGLLLPRLHVPDAPRACETEACVAYERSIRDAGGIGFQLLGIGRNGHIGFNEPSSSLASRTRVVRLTESTREANRDQFPFSEEVPHQAMTMGVGTILDAAKLVVIATGEVKSWAVAAALEGPVTARVPASALQLHPDVTLVVDEPAASRLELIDYYREMQSEFDRLPDTDLSVQP